MPIFDAYTFTDDAERRAPDAEGPRPSAARSPALTNGNLRRCPGTAAPAPADGSAPFVDSGDLAERRTAIRPRS